MDAVTWMSNKVRNYGLYLSQTNDSQIHPSDAETDAFHVADSAWRFGQIQNRRYWIIMG
jgi:hypothetical protein